MFRHARKAGIGQLLCIYNYVDYMVRGRRSSYHWKCADIPGLGWVSVSSGHPERMHYSGGGTGGLVNDKNSDERFQK